MNPENQFSEKNENLKKIIEIKGQSPASHARAEVFEPLINNFRESEDKPILLQKGTFEVFENGKVFKQISTEGTTGLYTFYIFKGSLSVESGSAKIFATTRHGCQQSLVLVKSGAVLFDSRSSKYYIVEDSLSLREERVKPGTKGEIF